MTDRPLLITLSPADGLPHLLDVVDGAAPGRWILVAAPDADAAVERVVADVLSGEAPVFGLAGVVTRSLWRGDPRVPARSIESDEDPEETALGLWREHAGRGPQLPDDVLRLLASDRVSARTRAALAVRTLADDPDYRPQALTAAGLATLRAVACRVVPQDGARETWLDLAARVDAQLAAGLGDGWRPAVLPPDREAYELALAELAEPTGLDDLDEQEQDAVLAELADGERTPRTDGLTASQLAAWFEDAVNDLVRQWLAHPANLTRIGFDGYATGGAVLLGFPEPAAPDREPWEPAMPEPATDQRAEAAR